LVPARAALALALLIGCAAAARGQANRGTITGTVVDGAGQPVPELAVVLRDRDGISGRTETDGRGRFHLSLDSGIYELLLGASDAPAATRLQLIPGGRLRLDVRRPGADAVRVFATSSTGGASIAWAEDALAGLPLDRSDAAAALLELAPGVSRGAAFGSAVGIGTPRRVDGLDLTDPFDGQAWTSAILPAVRLASVRAGIAADEPDGSGAVVDLVTRAGGAARHATIDVQAAGASWTRDWLDEATLAANPSLATRSLPGRTLRVAAVLGGPLTTRLRLGLAVAHSEEAAAGSSAVARTPRVHGRLAWSSGARSAGVVGFADRRSTSHDVPATVRERVAPGVENRVTASTVATRATWQGPVRALRVDAAVDLLRGTRNTAPVDDVPAHEDDVTGLIRGSLGVVRRGERTRLRAGGTVDWRTPRAGGHDLRAGGEIERATVLERAAFPGGEYFHDLAGRPDTVDVWAGAERETTLARAAAFVTDTWQPARRLSIVAGLRVARMTGGEGYAATALQPRVAATLGVGDAQRLVLRGHAGVVADPIYATHVDRTVGGDSPIVTSRILPGGRRVELERTSPMIARAGSGLRHPEVREVSGGADVRLTRGLDAGGTLFLRRFAHAIDATLPDARWLALPRTGLANEPLTVYRWLNRQPGDVPTIANVDGLSYLTAGGQSLGVAAATRDYSGVLARVRAALPRDRGAVEIAFVTAVNRGTLDDTYEAGIQRSDRFASPTAALTHVDGDAATTPGAELTVFGTVRLPVVPVRISGVYLRQSGIRYAAMRTFTAETLGGPFDAAGRTALLEPRGARTLRPVDDLSLRVSAPLPAGGRRVELYVDVLNALRRATVIAVETGAPLGVTSGTARAFETPLAVQAPFRVLVGARVGF
jgi:hypothetical protein